MSLESSNVAIATVAFIALGACVPMPPVPAGTPGPPQRASTDSISTPAPVAEPMEDCSRYLTEANMAMIQPDTLGSTRLTDYNLAMLDYSACMANAPGRITHPPE